MKRFWKEVSVEREGDGWTLKLDGRPVRTPARSALVVPTEALALAIAEEWRSVGDELDPRAMPLTGLANAAIDRIAPDRQAFAGGLAKYAEADLACYRSEWPPELVERQAGSWDELLAWGRRRYDVDFATTSGLLHVPQPQATIERLSQAVAELDPFHLAGLSPLVTAGGSLLAGLAVLEKAMSAEAAWQAVSIDERWQLEQWGADKEAEQGLEGRRRDFLAAARFLELLD
ncbi:MAG TPA: ATP12 family protein [Sphingomicrobium sp.]|nr:ATP12 family protein [Sphingomicrobium sp.]